MFFVRRVAIVGITRQTVELLEQLLELNSFEVVRIIDPAHESLHELETIDGLTLVVDSTGEPQIFDKLHSLMLGEARIETASGVWKELVVRYTTQTINKYGDILKLALSIGMRVVQADFASLILQDAYGQKKIIETGDGREFETVEEESHSIEWEQVEQTLNTGESVLNEKAVIQGGPITLKQLTAPVSYFSTALKVDGMAVGVIYLSSTRSDRVFNQTDVQKVESLCSCIIDILGYPHREVQFIHGSVFDSTEKILALPLELAERFFLLTMKIGVALKADRCNYYSYDHTKQAFFREASSSLDEGILEGKKLKLNDHLAKKVLKDRQPIQVQVTGAEIGKWYLVQPVIIEDNLVGALYALIHSNKTDMQAEHKTISLAVSALGRELKKQAEQEIARIRTVRYSAVLEACFELAKASTWQEVAQVAAANACLIMEAQSCFIRLVGDEDTLPIAATFSLGADINAAEIEGVDEKIAREVLSGSGVTILDPHSSDVLSTSSLNGSLQTGMSMWLSREGKRIGTLSLYNRQAPNPFGAYRFSGMDKDIFLHFCVQTAKAFDRFF